MELLWLNDLAGQDKALVGGKVAHLSLLASRYQVPTGFCLTTHSYARWNNGSGPLPSAPDELRAMVAHSYRQLAEQVGASDPGVAVRSSAVDEDGATASFAGQYETFLNVKGADAVADAVLACWASARSERLLTYRAAQGLAADSLKLAVFVQQLVYADASAIAFSANPVTCARDEVVINASWGLGESVVGGTVTPDTFIVGRPNLTITSRMIADKQRMTIAGERTTREVNVPRLLRTEPSLNEEQVFAIAQLALDLEAEMGWPVDIETVIQANQLYLLQCRPITSLA